MCITGWSVVCTFVCPCQVIVKQEVGRKLGLAIQPQEEELKVRLEHLQTELDRPAQFKVSLTSDRHWY